MKLIIAIAALAFLNACHQAQYQYEQANSLCQIDFGFTPGTLDYQNCRKWVLHFLQTGTELDYATFVCNSTPTADRASCIDRKQDTYQEMMRVNKEVTAVREEKRKREQEKYVRQASEAKKLRQEQVRKQEQDDHQKCTGYGLKKGTNAYAECRMKIEAVSDSPKTKSLKKMTLRHI